MTLVTLESGRRIMIDCKISAASRDQNDGTPDVAEALRERLEELGRDSDGRLYVDVFCLSHPDQDHCLGFEQTFHTGALSAWSLKDDKIVIREIWSSPIVFRRRARSRQPLCDDALVFNAEVHRRIDVNRASNYSVGDGDRLLILGEDENGKSCPHQSIVVCVGSRIPGIAGVNDATAEIDLLGPLPHSNVEEEEEKLAKNRSSVIMRMSLTGGWMRDAARFLTCGDAEVDIWERQWALHARDDKLTYDILLSPHHCSWHSLSHDSWSKCGEAAKVSLAARSALSQVRNAGTGLIIASSKPVSDDDSDPPCIRAKREYLGFIGNDESRFLCTGSYPNEAAPAVMDIDISPNGLIPVTPRKKRAATLGSAPILHGR
jgi:hypothetical protein